MFEIKIKRKKILVIGDSMLDIYHIGKVNRISPEAPIPVVKAEKELTKLGGAANVAGNIASLQTECTLLSSVGEDVNRFKIIELLKKEKIDNNLIITNKTTTTKIRIMNEQQQMVRLDFEDDEKITKKTEKEAIKFLKNNIVKFNGIIISDYGKGFCTFDICQTAIRESIKYNIPVIIDPKGVNWEKYKGATIVCPNLKEVVEITNKKITNSDIEVKEAGSYLVNKYGIDKLLITRSEKGMTIVDKDNAVNFRSTAKEVFDVSGAGDTVISTLMVMMLSGHTIEKSVNYANIAAGIVVSKIGTSCISLDELRKELNDNEFLETSLPYLLKKLNEHKESGKKIVFTNGCFDIIHKGHIAYLAEAKKLGEVLVVGLNSDKSVERLKGKGRPFNQESDRVAILSALSFVDYVVVFNEETPQRIIEDIKPDILVKGGDYKYEEIVGREIAGKTVVIPYNQGYSTSSIVSKIREEVK